MYNQLYKRRRCGLHLLQVHPFIICMGLCDIARTEHNRRHPGTGQLAGIRSVGGSLQLPLPGKAGNGLPQQLRQRMIRGGFQRIINDERFLH
ncbi:hypothetical protein D3C75_1262240 [compost metagenome]